MDWSFGTILFQKYMVSFDNSNEMIGMVGTDIICNEKQELYIEYNETTYE